MSARWPDTRRWLDMGAAGREEAHSGSLAAVAADVHAPRVADVADKICAYV